MKRFIQYSNYFSGGLHFAGLYHNIDDNIYIWYNVGVKTIYSRFLLGKKITQATDIKFIYRLHMIIGV